MRVGVGCEWNLSYSYSYRIWILLHIIPFKSDIWTRSFLSLSLSLFLCVCFSRSHKSYAASSDYGPVCLFLLFVLSITTAFCFFCFLIIIFITFSVVVQEQQEKGISTAIVWAGHYNSQRVDSARRLTRLPTTTQLYGQTRVRSDLLLLIFFISICFDTFYY